MAYEIEVEVIVEDDDIEVEMMDLENAIEGEVIAEEDEEPRHASPSTITIEGMIAAALDTVRQNIQDGDLRSIVVGYDYSGDLTFSRDFGLSGSCSDGVACMTHLLASEPDMWFMIKYSPFLLSNGIVIRDQGLCSALIVVHHSCDGPDGLHGFLGVIRHGSFVLLDMPLVVALDGGAEFVGTYNKRLT